MALVLPPFHINVNLGFRSTGDPDPYSTAFAFSLEPLDTFSVEDCASVVNWILGALPEGLFSPSLFASTARVDCNTTEIVGSVDVNPDAWTGSGADGIPQNSAYLLNKQGSGFGRQNRGRNFLPGVEESRVDNVGVVGAPTLSALQDFCDVIRTLPVGAPSELVDFVILHDEDSPPMDPTPVVQFVPNAVIGTQRRRLR